MSATGDGLVVDIDEVTVPIPKRVRGRVHLSPGGMTDTVYALDAGGRHHWHPIAPLARVEVDLDRPGMRFSGHGYLDTNWGAEPVEAGFRFWSWSRGLTGAGTGDERAAIMYDCERSDGSTSGLALMIDREGVATPFTPPPRVDLPRGLWRIPRPTRSDQGSPARLVRPLEDAPFYTRSVIATCLDGMPLTSVHESLSLDRFKSPIVQWMLPFRMPRRR
jgi:carotenoid 1,2-hydratase